MRRCLLAVLAMLAGAIVAAPAAHAAEGIQIEHVEASGPGRTTLLVSAPTGVSIDPSAVRVSVDGAEVAEVDVASAARVERTSVILLDTSTSMRGPSLTAAVAAARTFLRAVPADVRVGLVTFDLQVRSVVAPTTDRGAVAGALDGLRLGAGTRLYDGVIAGVKAAGQSGSRSLLVLSDGRDDSRTGDLRAAVASAKRAGTVIDVVSLDRSAAGRKALGALVSQSGGRVVVAERAALTSQFAERAADLAHQVALSFATPQGVSGSTDIEVSVQAGGEALTDSTYAPLEAAPAPAPAADALAGSTPGWVPGPGWLLGGGAILAVGLAAVLALLLGGAAGRREPSLADRVGHFTDAPSTIGTSPGPAGHHHEARDVASLKDSAVGAADKVMSEQLEERLVNRLQGAGSRLSPAEWLLLHAAIAVVAGGLGLLTGGIGRMVIFFALGAVVPWLVLKMRHRRRVKAFNGQLAEMLQLVAGGLSAGLSMPQALNTVANEAAEPMAGELKRALVEQRLGVDVTDALEAMADRMESQDARWVVMAMRIQREVGGNLAELLLTVSATLRERDDIRRKVAVLASEGKLSAMILSALPVLMFVYMFTFRRDSLRPLYTEQAGIFMLIVGVLMLLVGGFWMSRMVKVEV